jgi:hypothetical protein
MKGGGNDPSFVEPTPYCCGFKFAVPLFAAFIATLIAISQCQLAFETEYRYDWNVKNIKENGDGKTYSYNMWRGVYQVIMYNKSSCLNNKTEHVLMNIYVHFFCCPPPPPFQLYVDGAAPLAFVVLIWSGVFPYVKLILITLIDARSHTNTRVSGRWSVLSTLAKWSFLDVKV